MAAVEGVAHETGDKGLRAAALGFISSVVIGVASTAPGYSLAASLGLVTIVVGIQAPALTGFACPIYYRHHLGKSLKNFLFIGVSAIIGGLILTWAFFRSAHDLYYTSDNGTWFGIGQAFIIGIGFLAVGVILMFVWQSMRPAFFRRRPEVVDDYVAVHGAVPVPLTEGAVD